jgi:ribosomal protein S18 acetylase RimI-like enzyme
MVIVEADIRDSETLTSITKRSKAYWGYTNEQMNEWSKLLTITEAYIEKNAVFKLLIADDVAGYYSFLNINEHTVRLDNLFVIPQFIGKGFGNLLLNDFLTRMGKRGTKKILLDADPNAEGFYTKFGFIKVGQIETSIKDRYLPIMELNLTH